MEDRGRTRDSLTVLFCLVSEDFLQHCRIVTYERLQVIVLRRVRLVVAIFVVLPSVKRLEPYLSFVGNAGDRFRYALAAAPSRRTHKKRTGLNDVMLVDGVRFQYS
jgi:hypothetical protein